MPISRPASVVLSIRITPEERARLDKLCEERDVTLTWALREGLRLYAEDASRALPPPSKPPIFPEGR